MNSVPSTTPMVAPPIVPLADIDLATHDAGITAAVELAADFFHDRVEGFLVGFEEAGR